MFVHVVSLELNFTIIGYPTRIIIIKPTLVIKSKSSRMMERTEKKAEKKASRKKGKKLFE